jgi:hypothetical protein
MKTQIVLANRLDYLPQATKQTLIGQIDELRRQVGALPTSIEKHNARSR